MGYHNDISDLTVAGAVQQSRDHPIKRRFHGLRISLECRYPIAPNIRKAVRVAESKEGVVNALLKTEPISRLAVWAIECRQTRNITPEGRIWRYADVGTEC